MESENEAIAASSYRHGKLGNVLRDQSEDFSRDLSLIQFFGDRIFGCISI